MADHDHPHEHPHDHPEYDKDIKEIKDTLRTLAEQLKKLENKIEHHDHPHSH